jgi:cysteinyl-tRNA synthetase
MLKIHNSLTGTKQVFVPIRPGEVRMYVCGMTVYDYIHVGHARMLSVFDMVQRYLRYSGYRLTYVRNITDIDDKIITRAAALNEPWNVLAQRFIDAMNVDCDRLGLQKPDCEPRATEYIAQIIDITRTLVSKGMAYVATNGDVLYAVRKFPAYGQLSGKNVDDLRSGARVQVDTDKNDPLDFVLWKPAKPGEPSWESPWGAGRPGWHIECSAMSMQTLGPHFDIHGGGMDLKFPHHENEIAQSCGACDTPFVNIWMHNGFVRINDEKMSKSLDNFFTVRDVLDRLRDPEVMRLFLLSSHYRGPINYSQAQLDQADETLRGFYLALRDAPVGGEASAAMLAQFTEAMDDDFNTPEALAVAQRAASDLNVAKDRGDLDAARKAAASLRAIGAVLGLLGQNPETYLKRGLNAGATARATGHAAGHATAHAIASALADADIDALVEQRHAARQSKDFALSDKIRDQLVSAGVLLEDKPGGATQWRRA